MDCTKIIGEKIKALRTAQEITLEELAERTGLSKEQIESIEQNINIPSLAPLVKIARALGVRLGTFLDDQPNENGPVVCRCGEADDTISFSNNSPDARQNLHYHSLSRSKTDRHMEPFVIDIDPNPENGFTLSAHEGEEFIMVYNPQIQISAESETKRSIFREKDKTKRSKKESAQHSKSRNKSFVMTSVSAL